MDLDANRSLIVAALARVPGGDRAALPARLRKRVRWGPDEWHDCNFRLKSVDQIERPLTRC
jgi:hypothetical protein